MSEHELDRVIESMSGHGLSKRALKRKSPARQGRILAYHSGIRAELAALTAEECERRAQGCWDQIGAGAVAGELASAVCVRAGEYDYLARLKRSQEVAG